MQSICTLNYFECLQISCSSLDGLTYHGIIFLLLLLFCKTVQLQSHR